MLNRTNVRRGIRARRGDGTFGEAVPGQVVTTEPGHAVARGSIATVEIGCEVKILHKSMIKQIDRVTGDLRKQVDEFRRGAGRPISVGIVGVNHAAQTTGYEGSRSYPTDGRRHRHPAQEAQAAIQRLLQDTAPAYDEFVILPYSASNEPPFDFAWVNAAGTEADYVAALVRISREYEHRM